MAVSARDLTLYTAKTITTILELNLFFDFYPSKRVKVQIV